MTLDEVKFAALELLGVAQEGVAITASQSARLGQSYDIVYDELKDMGLATWVSAGPIPDKVAPHVEAMMAYEASDAYYVADARLARIMKKESVARREIARLASPDYESMDDPVDY